jgi:formamidopyrimidine-DNA glycosylase
MPEVETVVRSLRKRLPGRRIKNVEIFDPKLAALDTERLRGRRIRAVSRSGKEIVLDLSAPRRPLWLCVHLRMTGRLLWAATAALGERHLRARFTLTRGALLFYDARRFGVVRLAESPADFAPPGVEILAAEFTPAKLAKLLAGSAMPLKPWLLRQDRIVGCGNIYASEVCHAAGLDPRRPAGSLTPVEIRRLHRETRRIFAKAIECGGTTIDNFMDCEGQCGNYRSHLKVYEREGERCLRRGCPGEIARLVQAGRSTYFCPVCQTAAPIRRVSGSKPRPGPTKSRTGRRPER